MATTMEKLFLQISDRRKWIIDQVKNQTDLFDQHLASKCLLDGIPPPPWLWSPSLSSSSSSSSSSSLPNELNKEELISGLLLPRAQPSNPYSSSRYSLYRHPAVSVSNAGLPSGLCVDAEAVNKGIEAAGDSVSVLPQFTADDAAQHALKGVPELDVSVGSPYLCKDVRVPESCHDHAQSLMRMQRSKSRQRALELRNSAKEAKSSPHNANDVSASTSRVVNAAIASLRYELDDELELVNCTDVNNEFRGEKEEAEAGECRGKESCNRISSSRAATYKIFDQHTISPKELMDIAKQDAASGSAYQSLGPSNDASKLPELVNFSVNANSSYPAEVASKGNCSSDKWVTDNFSGRITRSASSAAQLMSANEALGMGSCSYISKEESRLRASFDRASPQLKHADEAEAMKLSKSSPMHLNESDRLRTETNQSKEKWSSIYLERSESFSQLHKPVNDCSNLDTSCSDGKEGVDIKSKQQSDHMDDFKELVNHFDVSDECHEAPTSCERNEETTNAYCCGITRFSYYGDVGESQKADRSSYVAKHGDDHALVAHFSPEPPRSLSFMGGEKGDLQEKSGAQGNLLNCSENNDIVDMENCEAVVAETDTYSEGLVEAHAVDSGFKVDGTMLGVEDGDPRPDAECAMLVKAKQIDFYDGEECRLNENSSPALENKEQGASSAKQASTWPQSTEIAVDIRSVDYQEVPNSSLEVPTLEEQKVSIREEKPEKDSFESHGKNCAVLLDESIDQVAQQKMIFAFSQEQSADYLSLGSWPQNKRMKIGSELTIAFSAPPTLVYTDHVAAAEQSCVRKSQNEDLILRVEQQTQEGSELSSPKLEVQEVEHSLGKRYGFENPASTLMHEELGTSLDLSLEGCYSQEKAEVADSTSFESDMRKQNDIEENQVLSQLEDRSESGSREILSSGNALQEGTCNMQGNWNPPCFSAGSPQRQCTGLTDADQDNPAFECFIMDTDEEHPSVVGEEINLDKLNLPHSTLERASVLEQLCKSACLHTPLSQFSTTYNLHKTLNTVYQSIPNGLLEAMDLRGTLIVNKDIGGMNEDVTHALDGRPHSDTLSFPVSQSWDIKKPYASPVETLWDGIASKSSSSKRASSIPELPCINEENENIEDVERFQGRIGSDADAKDILVKREALADILHNSNLPVSVCGSEILGDRHSLASVGTEFSFIGTCNGEKPKGNRSSSNRRCVSKGKENQSISRGLDSVKRAKVSHHSRFSKSKVLRKPSLRKGGPSLSERESKRNNIVSNITSFIPLVQQKPPAGAITGKRDVKVKALEAAEAAKRLAEKKENERKTKKEALKLERAKMEEHNLRTLEIEKEKKEEERKKKEADMAARKRLREEEEKKEKERKRKRLEETRRKQMENGEKLRIAREEKESKFQAADERARDRKEAKVKAGKHDNMERANGDDNLQKWTESEPVTTSISAVDIRKASSVPERSVPEGHEASSNYDDDSKVTHFCQAKQSGNSFDNSYQEQSYEMSPYRGSDDEDEDDDEDDVPSSKFVPSWASSKNLLAQVVSSQQRIDPESIFSPESFCSISEVLLPRRLQQK